MKKKTIVDRHQPFLGICFSFVFCFSPRKWRSDEDQQDKQRATLSMWLHQALRKSIKMTSFLSISSSSCFCSCSCSFFLFGNWMNPTRSPAKKKTIRPTLPAGFPRNFHNLIKENPIRSSTTANIIFYPISITDQISGKNFFFVGRNCVPWKKNGRFLSSDDLHWKCLQKCRSKDWISPIFSPLVSVRRRNAKRRPRLCAGVAARLLFRLRSFFLCLFSFLFFFCCCVRRRRRHPEAEAPPEAPRPRRCRVHQRRLSDGPISHFAIPQTICTRHSILTENHCQNSRFSQKTLSIKLEIRFNPKKKSKEKEEIFRVPFFHWLHFFSSRRTAKKNKKFGRENGVRSLEWISEGENEGNYLWSLGAGFSAAVGRRSAGHCEILPPR